MTCMSRSSGVVLKTLEKACSEGQYRHVQQQNSHAVCVEYKVCMLQTSRAA